VRFFGLNTFCFDITPRIFVIFALVSRGPRVYKDQRSSVEKFSDAVYNHCYRGRENHANFEKIRSVFLRRKMPNLPISGVRGISGREI